MESQIRLSHFHRMKLEDFSWLFLANIAGSNNNEKTHNSYDSQYKKRVAAATSNLSILITPDV